MKLISDITTSINEVRMAYAGQTITTTNLILAFKRHHVPLAQQVASALIKRMEAVHHDAATISGTPRKKQIIFHADKSIHQKFIEEIVKSVRKNAVEYRHNKPSQDKEAQAVEYLKKLGYKLYKPETTYNEI